MLPSAIGSGGAVISCFSLYSGLDCVASVLTVYKRRSVQDNALVELNKFTYCLPSKVGIGHR